MEHTFLGCARDVQIDDEDSKLVQCQTVQGNLIGEGEKLQTIIKNTYCVKTAKFTKIVIFLNSLQNAQHRFDPHEIGKYRGRIEEYSTIVHHELGTRVYEGEKSHNKFAFVITIKYIFFKQTYLSTSKQVLSQSYFLFSPLIIP